MSFTKRFTLKTTALSGVASMALVAAAPWALADPVQVTIDEGISLTAALNDFARQTDQQILFSTDIVNGKTAPALSGNYEPEAALEMLLVGSGLDYTTSGADTFLIAQAAASPSPADQPIQTAQVDLPAGASGEGEPVPVTGEVKAFGSEANLKGAQVEIVETGQKTATDNLGRFRFSSVAPGEYTLRITYLGRDPIVETIEVDSDGFDQSFAMGSEGTLDTIYVYGSRSARAQSLNQERTAENSTTVLASDFLGQFEGTTISETLRRAPGVAFEQNSVTGEGSNIIVRGLAPDLSQVTLNGLRLPEGSGAGRSPDLGNILTESISKVTISKTLLPSQDSSGSGGLVEIETKTPLDRPRRFASFSAQMSQRGEEFLDEGQYSGLVSGVFGSEEEFGLSASVQLVDSNIKRIESLAGFGLGSAQYLPLDDNGSPITSPFFVDPRTPYPFEPGVDDVYATFSQSSFGETKSENLTLGLSGAWQLGGHTMLFADLTSATVERDNFNRSAVFSALADYLLLPVPELDGEVRAAAVTEDVFAGFGLPGILLSNSQEYNFTQGEESKTQTVSFRGESNFGDLSVNYSAGYTLGETRSPLSGRLSLARTEPFGTPTDFSLLSQAALNNTIGGLVVSVFPLLTSEEQVVIPLLSDAGFDFYNDEDGYRVSFADVTRGAFGENERFTTKLSGRYEFNHSILKYVEAGAFFERADFRSGGADSIESVSSFGGAIVSGFGLSFTEASLSDVGVNEGFRVLSRGDSEQFVLGLPDASMGNPNLILNDASPDNIDLLRQAFTQEDNFSGYVQARFDVGKLEVVGGLRVDRIDVDARNLTADSLVDENGVPDVVFSQQNTRLIDENATQTVVLPRAVATYRANDQLLFRAGFSQSVSRPQINLLSQQQTVSLNLRPSFGLLGNRPRLRVRTGNPDLKPAKTTSIDLSAEYYFQDAGQIELSLFYKDIDNLLEGNSIETLGTLEGVILPDNPVFENLPDNILIESIIPVNNPNSASIWGVEAVLEKQLTFLPGALSGLGVLANYTYTDSEKVQPFNFTNPATFQSEVVALEGVRFAGDPSHSGTAAVTYNKYNLDATLSYTVQGRQLRGLSSFRLDAYSEAVDSLDFRAEYRIDNIGRGLRLWVEGADLLRGGDEASIIGSVGGADGVPKYTTSSSYFGGREFTLGVSTSF